ncbi:MAG: GAF domain-containing protein [Glaciecola sp.]|jgi:GAF domain-containing protein
MLVITSAKNQLLLAANSLVLDLGVEAYLGVPLRDDDGNVLGTFCAMDRKKRDWSQGDLEVMRDLAEIVRSEIALRASLAAAHRAERHVEDVLSVLAHDLRSPLAVVFTGARTLLPSCDRIGIEASEGLLALLEG